MSMDNFKKTTHHGIIKLCQIFLKHFFFIIKHISREITKIRQMTHTSVICIYIYIFDFLGVFFFRKEIKRKI